MTTPDLKHHLAQTKTNLAAANRAARRITTLLAKDEWTAKQEDEYDALKARLTGLTQTVAKHAGRIATAVDFTKVR